MNTPTEMAPVLLALVVAAVPAVAAWALWLWNWPDRAFRGGMALAALWNATWLLPANLLALRFESWRYEFDGPVVVGMPLPFWFGWVVLWGVVAPLMPVRRAVVIGLLILLDLIYMPLLHPVVELGPRWWLADLAMIAVVAVPGLVLARSTTTPTPLTPRVLLQVALFSCLLLWTIPTIATELVDSTLGPSPPVWSWGVIVGAVGILALPGLTAVEEFRLAGGTPWPWDGTVTLVGSGPYRYVRSPMQLSGIGVLVAMALIYRQPVIVIAAVVSSLYARLFSGLEETDLERRFGADWSRLQAGVRRRLPSWRPAQTGRVAVVWIDLGCEVCRPVAEFLTNRQPTELVVRDAADHPLPLTRARYERIDGAAFDGVAAVGAALEHLHLGWAMVGWFLRFPVLRSFWQLVADAVGFGARPVTATNHRGQGTAEVPPGSTFGDR